MAEEPMVTQDTENLEGADDTVTVEDEGKSENKPDYKAKADALLVQLKAEKTKRKEYEDQVAKLKPKPEASPEGGLKVEDVLELQEQGYSPGEIKKLATYSKHMNLPLFELVKDDLIKSGIETARAKAKADNAIPEPSNRGFAVGDKNFMDMSPEERKANYQALMAKSARK